MSGIIIDEVYKEFYKEFYEQGHLNFALDCMFSAGSFDGYAEWLKIEPVATFTDSEHYSYDEGIKSIIYEDGEEQETYAVGMAIGLSDDVILHSPEGNQSMFYKLNDDYTVIALYVD